MQRLPYASLSVAVMVPILAVPAIRLLFDIGCWAIVMLDGEAGTMLNELVMAVALPAVMTRLYPVPDLVI